LLACIAVGAGEAGQPEETPGGAGAGAGERLAYAETNSHNLQAEARDQERS
jgi:hypothetical protein